MHLLIHKTDVNYQAVDNCDVLNIVWTLILTKPIHWRGCFAEQVIELYIYQSLCWWRKKLIYI